ncbi:MAG: protein O-mannosyl-transferase family [Anaerolineae bacterium]
MLVFPTLLFIYVLTLPPSLTWTHYGADGGDLVTAVALGRLPHPPGFPTYLLLGSAFVRLPWGDPAWRLNLLSALSAAGAAGLTAAAFYRASSSAVVALATGLSLGLAPLFWSQALIAEVYAPAAFFSAAILFLTLRRAPAWLLGVVWGLGVGVHPTLLFLAPLVLMGNHGLHGFHGLKGISALLRVHPRPIFFALLTAGALYGPVLLAWGTTPSPWADFSTPAGWWAYVSGRLYHGYLFGLPAAFWPRRLLAWVSLLARQFTPAGALLALWGWARLWWSDRGLALATALAFGAVSLYAVGYNTADSLVYLVPALPLAAFWLGVGLDAAIRVASSVFRFPRPLLPASCLLLPALQAALFWGQVDLHRDRSAVAWATQTLQTAPADAVLLTAQDGATFALWYVRDVLGQRSDALVVDRDLWYYPPYRRIVLQELGLESAPADLDEALARIDRPIVDVTNND